MKQGTILVYWGPLGAMVYFFITNDDSGRHVTARLGADPATASSCDFWTISPAWMKQELEAGRLELFPEGLELEDRERIDKYNMEHEI